MPHWHRTKPTGSDTKQRMSNKRQRQQRKRENERKQKERHAKAVQPPPSPPVPPLAFGSFGENPENRKVTHESQQQDRQEVAGGWNGQWRGFTAMEIAITAIMAIATVAQGWFGYWQWDATNKQWAEMIEANKFGKAAADAAKASNELAAANGRLQLRAWLGIEKAIMDWDEESSTAQLTFPIKNYGQTPAYDVRSIVEMRREPNEKQPTDWIIGADKESLTFSAPGHQEDHVSAFALSPGQYAELVAGKLRFMVSGSVEFVDVFGDDRLLVYQLTWEGINGTPVLAWDFQTDESRISNELLAEYYRDRLRQIRGRKKVRDKSGAEKKDSTTPPPESDVRQPQP